MRLITSRSQTQKRRKLNLVERGNLHQLRILKIDCPRIRLDDLAVCSGKPKEGRKKKDSAEYLSVIDYYMHKQIEYFQLDYWRCQ